MATLPTMGPHFVLKINLTINSLPDDWRNILHVTDGGSVGTTGDRYPWLGLSSAGIIAFKSEKNNVLNPTHLNFNIELGTKYEIEFRQVDKNGATFTEIIIDDEEKYSDENTSPITVENAKVFLSNNFRAPADATVEYFYLESYE